MNLFLEIVTDLFIFLGVCYGMLMTLFITGWMRLNPYHRNPGEKYSTAVSIIIPARNEEQTILQCITDIENQVFPSHLIQLILINDHSTDGTLKIIDEYILSSKKMSGFDIQVYNLTDDHSSSAYKKNAITLGIKHATGKLIVTSDADCTRGKFWLSSIVSYFEKYKPKFISGPVAFHAEKNWFEKFQTLEFLGLIGIGAGSIKSGVPVMCNGANLAFTKEVFKEVNGFDGVTKTASGDDVFLMLKVAAKYPKSIHFLLCNQAIVYTLPKLTLKDFLEQRKRWASKGTKYNEPKVLLIGLVTYLFNFMIFLTGIISFFYNTFTVVFLVLTAVKIVMELLFLTMVTTFFKRRNLLTYFFPEQLLYIPYIVWVGALGTFTKFTWKGRLVK
jgi:cellulose synthase/poly-beta-1,6-N-acetylglucosamine synthase-like glycosyltransferase